MQYILIVISIWNLITFSLMGIDKYKSKKGHWRIKENTLLICAFLMGGVGSLLGMIIFHHKTKHAKFVIGLPLCIIANILILYYCLRILS